MKRLFVISLTALLTLASATASTAQTQKQDPCPGCRTPYTAQ